jgi:lipopolysaccharide transport system ATP-binding protein
MKRLKDFRAGGGSIVFVSHDLNAVKVLCDKALLLDKGRVVEDGNPEDVVNVYNFLIAKRSKGQEIACQIDQEKTSYGNNKINVESLDIIDSRGNKADVLLSGKPVEIKLFLNANQTVSELTVGILIRDKFGQDIFGTNTFHMNQSMQMEQDGRCEVSFFFEEFNLGPGKYSVSVSLHTGDTHVNECYQWVDRIKTFEVINGDDFIFIGISRLKPVLTIEGKIKAS